MVAKYHSLEDSDAADDWVAAESEKEWVPKLLFSRTGWYVVCGLLLGLLFGLFLGLNLRFVPGEKSDNLDNFKKSPLPNC